MILKRSIYQRLLAWKTECHGTKALLIEGARRIGKSTLVEDFAKREYKSYILIDFFKETKEVRDYFFKYRNDLDTLFKLLSVYFNTPLYSRESVIIFDEVQFFPQARGLIKYLVRDGRYDYIETGSLISIKENVRDIIIPSEERHIKMYPLDFFEFCLALNQVMIIPYIKQCWEKEEALDPALHEKAMMLFRQYMLVGGMPQSVIAFLENDSAFAHADSEKRDILSLYRSDVMRINKKYQSKVLAIYDQIPGLLSSHEKRVIFNALGNNARAFQYEETFFWLTDSMIVNECRKVNDPQVGLSLTESDTYLKCYFGDTGLLVSHAFDENELVKAEVYKLILSGHLNINKGMLYENIIAQMLTASNHRLFFYTHYDIEKKRNDIEIDFIVSTGSKTNYKITPIEVKSSKNYSMVSLERFKEKFKDRIDRCIVIHPRNLTKRNDILAIPPYMAGLL